jgi:hypothetical protein
MNRTYRIAALVIALAFIATVIVVLRPAAVDAESPVSTTDSALAIRQEAEHQEADASVDPTTVGEGETAGEAQRYSVDQHAADLPAQWQAIFDHDNASQGPQQPIPFNHRFHSGDLQIDCMYCHTGTEKSSSGVVPAMDVCMGCHQVAGTGLDPVEEMRVLYANGQPVEWKWVNKLPEFVQFNHRPHLRNNLECAECHGPVEEMDRVYQWAPFTMGWCLECHRSEPRSTDVATDHIVAQSVEPIAEPGELQELSYYPKAIYSEYGRFRGPTDCAACHY